MEILETTKIMERIKQHYQDFIIDDYKIEEWHNELSKYDFKEVNDKLDQHMRSEQYGQYIPKLFFLTRNLKTLQQKSEKKEYIVICPFCKTYVNFDRFDSHRERCSSVDFIQEQCERFNLKSIDKNYYRKMPQEQFEEFYNKLLKFIESKTDDTKELNRLMAIKQSRFGQKVQFNFEDIM